MGLIVDEISCRIRKWLWPFLVIACFMPGCIGIPVGSREIERYEISRETIQNRTLKKIEIKPHFTQSHGEISVNINGTYDEIAHDRVQLEKKISKRRLVVGLFPAEGAHVFGDRKAEFLNGALRRKPMQTIIISPVVAFGCGICTPISWLSEFWTDWDEGGFKDEGIAFALIGWAKTARQDTVKSVEDEPLIKKKSKSSCSKCESYCSHTQY